MKTEGAYHELAGHPLPCSMENAEYDSSLRILRAAATHFPLLHKFVVLLYEAIRLHRQLDSIDSALCAGDFSRLVQLCGLSDYKVLFKACSVDEACSSAIHVSLDDDDTSQPIRLQEPKLPDLESDLHVEHAELIEAIEKDFADDAEFPCCSCERLYQRQKVTEFKFSDSKFHSNVWKSLQCYILQVNPSAGGQTHYVCQFCRSKSNGNTMPNPCILNGWITEPIPKQLKELDPLSKQIIQRGKAFQAIIRLGTYMGKVPSYNSLKACKGTMLFLPLPLDKTLQTIKEVENNTTVGLPDPELYILISGKLSKNKVLWQSLVNVDQVKAAGPSIGFMLM